MSDTVKVVVEIPKKIYEHACDGVIKFVTLEMDVEIEKAIRNGMLLPNECDIQRIIPKRVNVQKWIYTKCPNPNCNHELSKHHGDGYYSIEHKPDFCPVCGQALLWEDEVTK